MGGPERRPAVTSTCGRAVPGSRCGSTGTQGRPGRAAGARRSVFAGYVGTGPRVRSRTAGCAPGTWPASSTASS
ncbi:hypothetical protein HBB16_00920 [Pseudonocardia sp. MCCB 268]|nr:hypothetical protein [Pseudonocardia cytotoxica]